MKKKQCCSKEKLTADYVMNITADTIKSRRLSRLLITLLISSYLSEF